jgi:hypothetical protein
MDEAEIRLECLRLAQACVGTAAPERIAEIARQWAAFVLGQKALQDFKSAA